MWRRCENAPFRVIDGECVVIPVRRRVADLTRVLWLNRTATWLWLQLDRPAADTELIDSLVGHFRVERDTAAADFSRVFAELDKLGVIHRGEELCPENLANLSPT